VSGRVDDQPLEDLLRELAPQVLGALLRRYRHFDACEDAVQEALLAASVQWPRQGRPDSPRGWLITVASRRLTDDLRSDQARRRREDADARRIPSDGRPDPDGEHETDAGRDDTLTLLFLCCHPALTPSSQLALTLRAVGGLTTGEIAHAFLVPETTMAQRISRAKQTVKATGASFELPPEPEQADRLRVVLQVLYLMFNEGYVTTAGPALARRDLTAEAIRLTREIRRLLPDDGEVAGLLALMLLTDARRAARVRPDGGLVPLAEQDRSRWDRMAIEEGVALVTTALATARLGPYQVQAAIAAVHDEAPHADETDWAQVALLYEVLERLTPSPVVTLNRAVAVAMTSGPSAGLGVLATVDADGRLSGQHRLEAVRGHLLEMAGDLAAAQKAYLEAARRTMSVPERRYLEERAGRLAAGDSSAG
jgi:RNA polymerase sigma factor (sigma-70 family)